MSDLINHTKGNNTIRIGGVPEHFNLPIHLAIENGNFLDLGLNIEWTTFRGGTGQMCKALRENEIDVCILLTEGIIADMIKGNPSKITSIYVQTPLCWGIHTGNENVLQNYKDIYSKRYGISRFGSGSHLMAIVDANSQGIKLEEEQFKIIKNLEGALDSLSALETDVFYWEKFTTKPHVDSGQLRRVGEYLTPWPCFVIAATDNILSEQPDNIVRLLRTIHQSCDRFMMEPADAIQKVGERYSQKSTDVEKWFHSTEWAIHGWVSNKMLKSVIYNLELAGIIDQNSEIPELIWKR